MQSKFQLYLVGMYDNQSVFRDVQHDALQASSYNDIAEYAFTSRVIGKG